MKHQLNETLVYLERVAAIITIVVPAIREVTTILGVTKGEVK